MTELHPNQAKVFWEDKRFKIVVCGRRWGKSRLGQALGLWAAIKGQYPYDPASPPCVVFAMPTLKQCKKIFWEPIVNILDGHPLVDSINRSDMIIRLTGKLPKLVFVGLNDNDGDRVRGLRIACFIGDEFQDVKAGILDEVIFPAMADTPGSIALFTGTPKGKVNHLYKMEEKASTPEMRNDWGVFHFFTADNPHIPREEIERAKLTLPPRVYRQEYEASYEDFPGKIFDQMEDRHRLRPDVIAHSRMINHYLGIDWGDMNPALVVIGESADGRYFILDEWHNEHDNPVLEDDFLKQAKEFWAQYRIRLGFADPSRPASIEKFNKSGLVIREGFNPVSEGNNTLNSLFFQNRLFFSTDPKFDYMWDCFGGYHRKSDRDGNILDVVAEGQLDHLCDCTRYLCSTLEREKVRQVVAKPPRAERNSVGQLRKIF